MEIEGSRFKVHRKVAHQAKKRKINLSNQMKKIDRVDRFRMTKLVVIFNWHFFLIAAFACLLGGIAMQFVPIEWLRVLIGIGIGTGIYFMIVSVIASYFVYDHSDMYQLKWWPNRAVPSQSKDWVLVHAGFDPASRLIADRVPEKNLTILDFYDPKTTTEKSIQNARKLFPPLDGEQQIQVDRWPLSDGSQDMIFLISAAHEIRIHSERKAFFLEANRVLRPGGRVVVIEQLRDFPNFMAFGGAVFHFLSPRTWRNTFQDGNFKVIDEFRLSPWMKAFVLEPT
jgi:SAM-dependent methyltransferase